MQKEIIKNINCSMSYAYLCLDGPYSSTLPYITLLYNV